MQNHLCRKLNAAGWECKEEHGWILLRKNVTDPPEGWYDGSFGPEAGCCASLLKRHAGNEGQGADTAQRALIKAGEKGEKAYETACRALHQEWAVRLRQGEALPVLSYRYFEK